MFKSLVFFLLIFFACLAIKAQNAPSRGKFDFGEGGVRKGYTQVLPHTAYTPERGYGFLATEHLKSSVRHSTNSLYSDFITSDTPFYFSVNLPEGDYDVTVYLGDKEGTSSTMVRAECRRLMVSDVNTDSGKVTSRTFTVHVRQPQIKGTHDSVRLKTRELSYLHWDNQLTLEFTGRQPKVCGLNIVPAHHPVTVFLAGNSTVVDQAYEPYAAWGQIIPVFFKARKIVVANYAESGETLKAFKAENRLKKILSLMKPGDFLFIEFAHNDQKPGTNHLDPFTTYKEMLKFYIAEVRKKGGKPVLVTSMHRRNFDAQGRIINTLGDYPEAVRQTAREVNAPLIDLNAMSKVLYEAWGPELSLKAFVHYPANTFPQQSGKLEDNTHFNPYGAWQLAKCVVEEIKKKVPELTPFLRVDRQPFDPAHPDSPDKWYWPLSLDFAIARPDGN